MKKYTSIYDVIIKNDPNEWKIKFQAGVHTEALNHPDGVASKEETYIDYVELIKITDNNNDVEIPLNRMPKRILNKIEEKVYNLFKEWRIV